MVISQATVSVTAWPWANHFWPLSFLIQKMRAFNYMAPRVPFSSDILVFYAELKEAIFG